MSDLPKCWNEPAFPVSGDTVLSQTDQGLRPVGLTIGQYAMIEAMQGFISNPQLNGRDVYKLTDEITASWAVPAALATLREYERVTNSPAQ